MPPRLVLDRKLLLENAFIGLRPNGLRPKSHSSLISIHGLKTHSWLVSTGSPACSICSGVLGLGMAGVPGSVPQNAAVQQSAAE